MKRFLVLAPIVLAACQNGAPTAKATVLSLESGLTATDTAALQYTSLPACGGGAKICADPTVKTQIKAQAQTAHDAIAAAQTAVDADPTGSSQGTQAAIAAALSALSSFEQQAAKLPTAAATTSATATGASS